MKILVAAKALHPDNSSEGICSAKFVAALEHAGHEVVALTSDPALHATVDWTQVGWLGNVRIRHVRAYPADRRWRQLHSALKVVAGRGAIGAYLSRKVEAAMVYATGYPSVAWQEVSHWKAAFEEVIATERPELVFVRSAGGEFSPHLAMLQCQPAVPWVAHYHDPFPSSLYPEPYRSRVPFVSAHQERLHNRILKRASALTFPSQRLMRWVVKDEAGLAKSFVMPHLGMDLEPTGPSSPFPQNLQLDKNLFTIVHVGTLLGPRHPWALISAYMDFLGDDEEKKHLARLVFVGPVNYQHVADQKWRDLESHASVVLHTHRVSYQQSLELVRHATAAIVLEAASAESPFFPAKLADYVWLQKPILAISPMDSVATDLLGPQYPLLAQPTDVPAIVLALETLWARWKDRQLDRLEPTDSIRRRIGEGSLRNEFDRLLSTIRPRAVREAVRDAAQVSPTAATRATSAEAN